jgi:hypothetical protein
LFITYSLDSPKVFELIDIIRITNWLPSFRRKPESIFLSIGYGFWMPDQVRHDERTLDSQVIQRSTF